MVEAQFSTPVYKVSTKDSLYDVITQMKTNFIKRIVVVEGNKPVGIVTERDVNRFLENDRTKRPLGKIPVIEIMKKNLITVVVDQPDFMHQCAARMVTFKIGSIIITDEDGDLLGITTKTDITKSFSELYSGRYKVRDYMNEKPITCRISDHLEFALGSLNKNKVSRLIVTDNVGHVKGIITTNTFLRHSEFFKPINGESREYLVVKKPSTKVADLINNEVLSVDPNDDLAYCSNLMVENMISGMPVTVNGRLEGVVTKFDVVRAFNDAPTHKELLEKYRFPL